MSPAYQTLCPTERHSCDFGSRVPNFTRNLEQAGDLEGLRILESATRMAIGRRGITNSAISYRDTRDFPPREATLHSAAREGNAAQVGLLLSLGASTFAEDEEGKTPLYTALDTCRACSGESGDEVTERRLSCLSCLCLLWEHEREMDMLERQVMLRRGNSSGNMTREAFV